MLDTHSTLLIAKYILMVFGFSHLFGNIGRIAYGQTIHSYQIYIMSACIAGFITLQWLL
jgi:hypothetical protein